MEAGLQPGDKVTKINGSKVFTSEDISLGISRAQDKPIDLQYERAGQLMESTLTPKYNEEMKAYQIGVLFNSVTNPTFLNATKHSLSETMTLITQNYKAIGTLVKGQGNFKTDIGGPVSIVKISSGAAKEGVWSLVRLVAIMSIGIGIFNLLPLPVLDGGTTILLLIELITRRKVPAKVVNVLNTVGVVFLFGLMLIVTVKDILFPVNM
jgi:regulator of sigma E protease